MKDIQDIDDIELMVNTFYAVVREDEVLGPIFNNVIKDNWPLHLDKMIRFWQTILLQEYTYKGSPFHPHRKLPIQKQHFDRWLNHFNNCIDKNFKGTKADEAKMRAKKMAQMFQYKLASNSL
ncbi:group III truncated hemoglobin [Spongiivirga citrea]|uniref:Globin n=1 Tax=Spongiivirga citrea TaxID=1481457 RepID=A0A6M0CM42_9FLAO|nr:group III truncated hemoglobin [Spongiivirga citrea]NER18961.1 globin [Spongiivirga citrea]